jgi:hypothetical protein
LDLIWPVLVLAGIEIVAITPGVTAVTPLTFVSYPWSHSLVMSVVWGILFGTLYLLLRRYLIGAVVIALLVVSHWLLDFVVHVPDLPARARQQPAFGSRFMEFATGFACCRTWLVRVGLMDLHAHHQGARFWRASGV